MWKNIFCVLSSCCALAHGQVSWFTGAQELEATGEVLDGDDILVQAYQLGYTGTQGPVTVETRIGYSQYDLTYKPVLSGETTLLEEGTLQGSFSISRQLDEGFTGTLTFGAYDGFAEYRSIWISELYRQQFGEDFAEYEAPDPSGLSLAASGRWDYSPGAGQATWTFGVSRDIIAPGWSFNSAEARPEAGNDLLVTVSSNLHVEQAINGWLKTEIDATLRKTTERNPRFGIRNSWAAASGPFTFRLTGGYTDENPSFDALYGTAIVDWRFHPQWSVHLGYRAYSDSGEIQSTGFNATAPGVDSREIFTGVQWDRGSVSVSGGIGYVVSNYEPLREDNVFFGNLYRDRDWTTFRLSASYKF